MARSTNWESADPKLGPFADAPTLADWETLETATKELQEAPEGLARASRVVCSGLGLAIWEDPLDGGGKKELRWHPAAKFKLSERSCKSFKLNKQEVVRRTFSRCVRSTKQS